MIQKIRNYFFGKPMTEADIRIIVRNAIKTEAVKLEISAVLEELMGSDEFVHIIDERVERSVERNIQPAVEEICCQIELAEVSLENAKLKLFL